MLRHGPLKANAAVEVVTALCCAAFSMGGQIESDRQGKSLEEDGNEKIGKQAIKLSTAAWLKPTSYVCVLFAVYSSLYHSL